MTAATALTELAVTWQNLWRGYWLPAGDAAWPEVALTLGRLSYDRYTDQSWLCQRAEA